ncbi:MAG: sodium-translocating pyrophosphatase [Candidatus Bilamarchaeaceae archaeon]
MIFGIAEVYFALLTGIAALAYAAVLTGSVLRAPKGSEKMQEISGAIQEGANAFLMRQYKTLLPIVIVLFAAIYYVVNMETALAFLVGVLSSALAGYIGMQTAVRGNVRVAEAAKGGLEKALSLAFRGGAVTGMALVGLGLIGLSGLYIIFGNIAPLIGYGFGASLISLFARVGGGIYTKAADVGADLVGKVEKGIPEDDPRNPAVIADNVGDNVGDCAGMAADVFESFVVTIIAAMLLGSVVELVMLPLGIAALGVLGGIVGSLFVRLGNGKSIMGAFYKGIIATAIIMLLGVYAYTGLSAYLYVAAIGIFVTLLLFLITEYYTGTAYRPVRSIAEASKTGAATNLITGLAVGMESTLLPVVVVVIAIALSYYLAGLYGVALAAAVMLSLSGIVIAVDSYGPITDNAGGIAEMSGLPEKVRKVTDALDAAGNTTKATTKGFAIGGAALGALALFVAFATESHLEAAHLTLLSAPVVIGLFIGALLPFIFSSLLMRAVGRAAFEIVEEVRRQFREIKGLMEGKAKADYAKCVDISTATALRELALPGIIAVFAPLVVGYLFGTAAVGGLLTGAIASGFLLALMMCTAGASWDNAKKYIETGIFGGKGSEPHKAAVIGDTVGDPLKDTAGPALNALIKVLNTVSLVFAGALVANSLGLLG